MMTRRQANAVLLATAAAAAPALATAEQANAITLPSPRKDGVRPLLRALNLRRSTREYSDRKLPPQVPYTLRCARETRFVGSCRFVVGCLRINRRAATAPHLTGATSWLSTSTRLWKMEFGCTSPRAHLTAAFGRGHSGSDRASGFCLHCAPQPCLCRPWRAHDRCYS